MIGPPVAAALLMRLLRSRERWSPAVTGVPPPGQASRGIDESRYSSSSSAKAARRKSPEYRTSSPASLIDLRPRPLVSTRGRCSPRSRISAARGSETARSRKPRSISASEGGSLLLRLARPGRHAMRGSPKLAGCHPAAVACTRARTTSPSSFRFDLGEGPQPRAFHFQVSH